MHARIRWMAAGVLVLNALGAGRPGPAAAAPDPPVELPFAVGEELAYRVRLGRLGAGRATLRVGGPEEVRGRQAWALAFDLRARLALAVVEDRARSWIDPARLATLRYHKRERSPLASHEESVEVFPSQRRWERADGTTGRTSCDAPLDELSFIYYLRTLPLAEGAAYSLEHHFDPERNPVLVRLIGRERVSVPAGEFSTLVVEMKVKDERRFGGGGAIRLFLTDDPRRIPVRIESSVPVAGSIVLVLEGWSPE